MQYCTVAWLEVEFCDEHVISGGAAAPGDDAIEEEEEGNL